MIEAKNVTMCFEDFTALSNLTCNIPSGCIYGLIGSNGAGKSTFLRLLSGIYSPKSGEILVDGMPVFDNPEAKRKLFFVPDELFFLPQATMNRMASFYRNLYPSFSMERFRTLTQTFGLNPRASIHTFSKGMRRQAATILGLSVRPEYMFFDETFDGLDPVMRNLVKDVIRADAKEYGTTVNSYITDVRLSEAVNMLRAGDRHIGEIATETGFSDQSYFSKVFSAKYGIPPSEYAESDKH